MGRLYRRSATLIIGPRGEDGKVYSGLRIAFDVKYTSASDPNTTKIQIFNLSPTSRALLERPGLYCILNAGYDGNEKMIFSGDIRSPRGIAHERRPPDIVTSIEGGDGEKALTETNIDQSYGPGTSMGQVMGSLTGKLGLPIGTMTGVSNTTFPNGVALSGTVKGQLDTMTKRQGLEWYVKDGELHIMPVSEPNGQEAVHITPSTGLIGSPVKREGVGIEFTSLFNHSLKPGRTVVVESFDFKGTYKVKTSNFVGDTHDGEFVTRVEAASI